MTSFLTLGAVIGYFLYCAQPTAASTNQESQPLVLYAVLGTIFIATMVCTCMSCFRCGCYDNSYKTPVRLNKDIEQAPVSFTKKAGSTSAVNAILISGSG